MDSPRRCDSRILSGSNAAMPSVELIAVGTEMLLGQLVDTNTAFVAARLAENGIDVHATHAVGDNRARIAAAVRDALERCRRHRDDRRTRPDGRRSHERGGLRMRSSWIPSSTSRRCVRWRRSSHDSAGRCDREQSQTGGASARAVARSQIRTEPRRASLPSMRAGRFVACMPGVPREMKPMLGDHGAAVSARALRGAARRSTRGSSIRSDLGESEIDHRIADLFRASENPKIAVLAHDFRADVK